MIAQNTGTVEPYSVGLCFASVCTDLPPEEAAKVLNEMHPTGVSPWVLANEDFADGTPNGVECPECAGKRHWLFVC